MDREFVSRIESSGENLLGFLFEGRESVHCITLQSMSTTQIVSVRYQSRPDITIYFYSKTLPSFWTWLLIKLPRAGDIRSDLPPAVQMSRYHSFRMERQCSTDQSSYSKISGTWHFKVMYSWNTRHYNIFMRITREALRSVT